MGDRDAFGREKGEDTLKEMGWTLPSSAPPPVSNASAPPAAASRPAIPETPIPAAAPARAPRRRRSGPGGGARLLRLIIPIAVFGAIAAAAIGSFSAGSHVSSISIPQIELPKLNIPTTITPAPADPAQPVQPAQPVAPAQAPVGLAAGSMLRPAAMRRAVARLRSLGKPYLLRLAADRINAQVVHGTKLRIVQIGSDGSFSRLEVTGVGNSLTTFPWSRVDALGPSRMVRAVGRRPSSVNYLVLSRFGSDMRLSLYLTNGRYYSAGAGGRHPQRAG